MNKLRKFLAPEIVFGLGALDLSGQYATNFGAQKVLLVTDPGVVQSGWARKVSESLEREAIRYAVFSDVSPNPRVTEVMAGAAFYQREACDVIVAVGGGSAIDCAKGIGIVSSNNQSVLSFEGIDNVRVPGPPMVCIPTTAGASADVSQVAIINDRLARVKFAIISKTIIPDVALIDPETTTTMDAYLTACTGMDALVHAIEAFVSSANSPLFDLHALEAVRLIHANLLDAIQNPHDLDIRKKMMLGSLEAGLAFSNASLGAVHAMAHSLGGFLDLPHGECNSILLNRVIAYNYNTVPERYDTIGEALGLKMKRFTGRGKLKALLDAIDRLKEIVGLKRTLGDLGVSKTDIAEFARKALKDPCIVTNPKKPGQRDLEVIYEDLL